MRRLIAATALLLALAAPASAGADFGLQEFDVTYTNADGTPATQAGSHPFAMSTEITVNSTTDPDLGLIPDEAVKDLIIAQIPGLVGRPAATPRCSTLDFLTQVTPIFDGKKAKGKYVDCPDSSAVGTTLLSLEGPVPTFPAQVYNLDPPPGVAAKLGFWATTVPVTVDLTVNPEPPHNVIASVTNVSQTVAFFASDFTIWGDPSDPVHDPLRGHCLVSEIADPASLTSQGNCPSGGPKEPFLTLPRACEGPLATGWRADSWQNPEQWAEGFSLTHDAAEPPNPQGFTGCGKLAFDPIVSAQPTSASAESSSGLAFSLSFKDEGLRSSTGLAQSDLKEARVFLPEGMTVNPSVAEGLGVCTPAQLARETLTSVPGEGCPDASKLGSVRVATPLLDEAIEGSVFLAPQDDPATSAPGAENPFDSLIALHVVLKHPGLGILVKLPLRVEPDPVSGRLLTTAEDIPQLPFSRFDFSFREGARAPLITPARCGAYATEAELTPRADPANPVTATSAFQVTSGPGGGPCPAGGVPPFRPGFEAGSLSNQAAARSPFYMRLTRKDGDQDLTKLSSTLPEGVLGSLVGVGRCPEAAIAAARSKSGRQELAAPSCPASSQIGRTLAGAGVGQALTYVPGTLHLAGPYKGAPLSVVSITPAVAGPFDAGAVVVRLGLDLDPRSARVSVDGSASDPIPHILKGIVLKVRDLRVFADRPHFTLNPTSCAEKQTEATLFGSFANVFDPADDRPVSLASRYQAAGCAALGFKPKLSLRLRGGTARNANPALTGTYTPRAGDANLSDLVVRMPRSAFLEQAHIRTICTRVQFAAEACPPGAVYGTATAYTPLLSEPLTGPVYLRSSDHELPDLVADLQGIVDVEAVARIDSAKGGIRATFLDLPDAPITKVVVRMQGGKKGLIANSADLCRGKRRAKLSLRAHNGKRAVQRPVVGVRCGKKKSR